MNSLGMHEHVTLMHPDARDPTARGVSSVFPVDLLSQSAGRLRVLALLYAFVFFMAGIFPALLFPAARARFLESFLHWGPGVIGIVVALLVAAVIRSPRLPLLTAMNLGLAFEVVSSYAIAAAEFGDPQGLETHSGSWGSPGSPSGSCCSPSSCPPHRAGRCWPPWPRSARFPSSSGS